MSPTPQPVNRDLPFLPLPYELRLRIIHFLSEKLRKQRFIKAKEILEKEFHHRVMTASYEGDCLEWQWGILDKPFDIFLAIGKDYIIYYYEDNSTSHNHRRSKSVSFWLNNQNAVVNRTWTEEQGEEDWE